MSAADLNHRALELREKIIASLPDWSDRRLLVRYDNYGPPETWGSVQRAIAAEVKRRGLR